MIRMRSESDPRAQPRAFRGRSRKRSEGAAEGAPSDFRKRSATAPECAPRGVAESDPRALLRALRGRCRRRSEFDPNAFRKRSESAAESVPRTIREPCRRRCRKRSRGAALRKTHGFKKLKVFFCQLAPGFVLSKQFPGNGRFPRKSALGNGLSAITGNLTAIPVTQPDPIL